MNAQMGLAGTLRRVFPTTVASHLEFRGWVRQEVRSQRMSVIFDLRQCAGQRQPQSTRSPWDPNPSPGEYRDYTLSTCRTLGWE